MVMKINFIGNFGNGYVGEVGDATHLVRELRALGHKVRQIPQDEFREYVLEGYPKGKYPNVPDDITADINIIMKWDAFYDERFINSLRILSLADVFYWVWDYMDWNGLPDWHIKAVGACDLYLGNDVRNPAYRALPKNNLYYFPFDVADGDLMTAHSLPGIQLKTNDVAFFGSWIDQGDRQDWLIEINKTNPITVFSWNWEAWPSEFDAHPPVYGEAFNREVAASKIILGFNVEPNCWGYWSNRVGKTLLAGGFLLQQYSPGMELFLRDGVEYFSSVEEAREKIDHFLIAEYERERISKVGWMIGQERFSSKERVKDLVILIERYLRKEDKIWMI